MSKIAGYIKEVFAFNKSERVWQMPFFGSLGVAIVLFASSYFKHQELGLVAIIGVSAFLYVSNVTLYHRMVTVMCASFAITLSFALGLLASLAPSFNVLIIFLVTMITSMITRYFNLGAPGYFFFVLSFILGSSLSFKLTDFTMMIGIVSIGGMIACLMVFLYSVLVIYYFKNDTPRPMPERGKLGFGAVFIDPVIIGLFVALAMFVSQVFQMDRGYWVAISCAVIMQGLTLKAVWIKHIQRVIGTTLGIFLAMFLLSIKFTPFEFTILMATLFFLIEFSVVRNYAVGIIFITPYTTYLVEVGNFMGFNPDTLMEARVLDIIVGSAIGVVGGMCLHFEPLRRKISVFVKKVLRFPENL